MKGFHFLNTVGCRGKTQVSLSVELFSISSLCCTLSLFHCSSESKVFTDKSMPMQPMGSCGNLIVPRAKRKVVCGALPSLRPISPGNSCQLPATAEYTCWCQESFPLHIFALKKSEKAKLPVHRLFVTSLKIYFSALFMEGENKDTQWLQFSAVWLPLGENF